MIDINELKPSTIETLKTLHNEHRDTIDYMQKFGTAFEKSIAALILAASDGGDND
jgi:hypothetical protein